MNTALDGTYFDSFVPTNEGLWTVTIEWRGNEHYGSSNLTIHFNVIKQTTEEPETPTIPIIPGFPIEAITIGIIAVTVALLFYRRENRSFKGLK